MFVKGKNRVEDHRKSRRRQPWRQTRINPPAPASLPKRPQRADQKLPAARRQEIEIRIRIKPHRPKAQAKAQHAHQNRRQQGPMPAQPPQQGQKDREKHIILLFDGEAPCMQQGFEFGRAAKISALLPEQDIGDEQAHRDEAAGELFEMQRDHPEPSKGHANQHHREKRGQDTPRAPLVEFQDGKAAHFQIAQQNTGDQIAGDDKKHIDAHIAAAENAETGMEQDHRQDGHRAQPVNLFSILHARPLPRAKARPKLALPPCSLP